MPKIYYRSRYEVVENFVSHTISTSIEKHGPLSADKVAGNKESYSDRQPRLASMSCGLPIHWGRMQALLL